MDISRSQNKNDNFWPDFCHFNLQADLSIKYLCSHALSKRSCDTEQTMSMENFLGIVTEMETYYEEHQYQSKWVFFIS